MCVKKKLIEMEEKEGTRKRTAVALEEEKSESESSSSTSSSSVQLKTRRLDDPPPRNFLVPCCSDEGSSSCEVTKPNFKLVDLLKKEEEEEEEVTREFVADDSVDFNDRQIMKNEIDLFFAAVERDTQKRFIAKYNFDIIKDQPLEEGRYEWVPIQPPSLNNL